MLRKMYDWCIEAAGKPHAGWIMGALAFAESSVLPIPPDTMMIPMPLARPDRPGVMRPFVRWRRLPAAWWAM
jgi:membrane protein YqaA with SNARE-associated domain